MEVATLEEDAHPAAVPAPAAATEEATDESGVRSPTLERQLAQIRHEGWKLRFGPAKGGSSASEKKKTITLDSSLKGRPLAFNAAAAHEVGHALDKREMDTSSRQAYVNSGLRSEGTAQINEIRVQREILAKGGPDILAKENPVHMAIYNRAYDEALRTGNFERAEQTIGAVYGTNKASGTGGKTYYEMYGERYDNLPLTKLKKFFGIE